MKIYDISMTINKDMQVYKNIEAKKPTVSYTSDYTKGNYFETKIFLDTHTGTHFDAPLHMVEGGATIESQDLYNCITKCKVFDLSSLKEQITAEDIKDLDIKENDFVIFKTQNSYEDEFNSNFVFIEKTAAKYLKDKKIKGIGVDALSVERSQPEHESHIALLGGEWTTVLEGLRLKDIKAGEYTLIALPLKLQGIEGSPTRAVLVDNI